MRLWPRLPPGKYRRAVLMLAATLWLCVYGFTWECASVAAQTDTRPVDLTPGDAGQVFAVPASQWASLNRFVFLIGFDFYAPNATYVEFATRVRQLPGYAALYAACQVWGTETFPTLQTLATELSKGDIKESLVGLQTAFQNVRAKQEGAQNAFAQQADLLNRRLTELGNLSSRVHQQFTTLYDQSNAVIAQYRQQQFPESPWVSIGPQLADVQYAVGAMFGRWNALATDLAHVQQLLAAPAAGQDLPKLYALELKVGLEAWEKLAQDATAFMTNAPAQRKYLSGESYYEDCPLREGTWYILKNSFLAAQGRVLAAQPDGLHMLPFTPGNGPQQWQFQRFGRGWWRVINRANGEAAALDVANDLPANYPPRMVVSPPGYFTGQWWRCVPTQNPGWFRFFNAFLGELRSLDTYSNTYTAFMGNTENYSGQYWQFEAVEGEGR